MSDLDHANAYCLRCESSYYPIYRTLSESDVLKEFSRLVPDMTRLCARCCATEYLSAHGVKHPERFF